MTKPKEPDQDLKSERSRLRRAHEKGRYDRKTMYEVLNAMPLAQIAYQMDGAPSILPTLQWREGDHVYWHGSSASRALRAMDGQKICMNVTCMDGYVLARSAFHHSVNFRSATLFGTAERIVGADLISAHLKTMVDVLFPDRWDSLRPMTSKEVKATAVMRMKIEEGAIKIRTGPPKDDAEDYDLPIWAGVVPMGLQLQNPIDDPANLNGVSRPSHLEQIKIG
ncbi:pyridoxamine 5'-phosphate oxidase family protein [Epibacterium ulvae]|uniref:pyridoxamine 5'-phosphate oxidase family protein n=1 Tax=Epibacterium ulvae TaxID=1156985 RepID=UPI00248F6A75|nr:pyridoxamine 5'-phosphate oxidase family protein [Epibacterium ulvae]